MPLSEIKKCELLDHVVQTKLQRGSWSHRGINYGTFIGVLLEWLDRLKANRNVCRKVAKVFLKRSVQRRLLQFAGKEKVGRQENGPEGDLRFLGKRLDIGNHNSSECFS